MGRASSSRAGLLLPALQLVLCAVCVLCCLSVTPRSSLGEEGWQSGVHGGIWSHCGTEGFMCKYPVFWVWDSTSQYSKFQSVIVWPWTICSVFLGLWRSCINVPIIHMNDWLKLLEIWISVWCLGVALQLDQDTQLTSRTCESVLSFHWNIADVRGEIFLLQGWYSLMMFSPPKRRETNGKKLLQTQLLFLNWR